MSAQLLDNIWRAESVVNRTAFSQVGAMMFGMEDRFPNRGQFGATSAGFVPILANLRSNLVRC